MGWLITYCPDLLTWKKIKNLYVHCAGGDRYREECAELKIKYIRYVKYVKYIKYIKYIEYIKVRKTLYTLYTLYTL